MTVVVIALAIILFALVAMLIRRRTLCPTSAVLGLLAGLAWAVVVLLV
jgi:hypothetical protein